MKRQYFSELISAISANMSNLAKLGIAGEQSVHPPMMMAVNKLRMVINAQFLSKFIRFISLEDTQALSEEETNEKAWAMYEETWQEYYSKQGYLDRFPFTQLWEEILQDNNIDSENRIYYEYAEMQTCILYQAMITLNPLGKGLKRENYKIYKDEFDEGIPVMSCTNILLNRAIAILGSTTYIPVFPDWKDNNTPAMQCTCSHEELKSIDQKSLGFKQIANKTLGDVWNDYDAIYGIGSMNIHKSILQYKVEHDLAQALAELSDSLFSAIQALGAEKDILGNNWDDAILTNEELIKLRQTEAMISELIATNARQQGAISTLTDNNAELLSKNAQLEKNMSQIELTNLQNEKVYSINAYDREIEEIGEAIEETPIIIPTRKQQIEYPDCRWILACSKDGKRYQPSPERYINAWKTACEEKDKKFWGRQILLTGLYLFIGGNLYKATDYDKNMKTIIKNAYNRDSLT